jgi:hypothetical protein
MIFQSLFDIFWIIFFENLALIWPSFTLKNLAFFETTNLRFFIFWDLATLNNDPVRLLIDTLTTLLPL